MDDETTDSPTTGVPKQAFEQFIQALKKQEGISTDIVDRLSTALIDHGDTSDNAIRTALFDDNDSEQ